MKLTLHNFHALHTHSIAVGGDKLRCKEHKVTLSHVAYLWLPDKHVRMQI